MVVPVPMLAVAGTAPDNPAWAIEMKFDGIRALSICRSQRCRIYSRNRREITSSFPEIAAALTAQAGGRELILDGEIIAPGLDGAPSFGLLQRRMHVTRPSRALIAAVPAQLFLFDILADDGGDVTGLSYLDRRDRLQALGYTTAPVQTPPYWLGIEADRLLTAARDTGLEGIMSKRIDSRYTPGRRSPHWIKTPIRHRTEGIVAGWTTGTGAFASTFGGLVLAAHRPDGQLVHIGNVGTGFTMAARRALRTRLDEIARTEPLFALTPGRVGAGAVHFVQPILVGSVEYREYSGGSLRHPSWKGLRTDIAADEVEIPS
ncbi:non-homologous end-joining DNA ligase [Nocardia carnea]|uniref:non-homologous end-joining DNA ligase n=1 Tax=Nocardia carnea TaxID=37328 RepID=UPI002456A7FC|nr:non-homologous end-joining DNA ligase [Nocardia carnea]